MDKPNSSNLPARYSLSGFHRLGERRRAVRGVEVQYVDLNRKIRKGHVSFFALGKGKLCIISSHFSLPPSSSLPFSLSISLYVCGFLKGSAETWKSIVRNHTQAKSVYSSPRTRTLSTRKLSRLNRTLSATFSRVPLPGMGGILVSMTAHSLKSV